MRRIIFSVLGLLELAVAGLLVSLGMQLPAASEVDQGFQSAIRVTGRAENQVRLLQEQVRGLRRVEFEGLAERLQKQTQAVARMLKTQSVDFDTVGTMRDALQDVAGGLDGLADTLNPSSVGKLSTGLGETARFLDEKVVPAAERAAQHLDQSTAALQVDAGHLGKLLQEAPPNFKAVREVHDSLARFREGLSKMNNTLKLERFETMREGFRGMESSLTTGSEQVERLADYTYTVIRMNGLKPEVSQKPFWPEGGKIAEGMRKAAAGATAAGKEMDGMAADLPRIRASLDESLKMVDSVRDALGVALEHQGKVEPLLKEIPTHAARLADELPRVGSDLSRILRDTQGLKEVAAALRQAQKGIDTAVGRWPELRNTLGRMATVLRATHDQLDRAVSHRAEYEEARRQSIQMAETFAALLPMVTDQLDGRLDEEEQTLDDLGESLGEVGGALPVYQQTASRLMQTGRILACLMAGFIGLHGCYLILSVRIGRRYSL